MNNVTTINTNQISKRGRFSFLFLIFLVLFGFTNVPFFPSASWPDFALCFVIASSWNKNLAISYPSIFIIGILSDAISGVPIGTTSMMWIIIKLSINYLASRRSYKINFFYEILASSILMLFYYLVIFLLLGLLHHNFISFGNLLLYWLSSSFMYIPLCMISNLKFTSFNKRGSKFTRRYLQSAR